MFTERYKRRLREMGRSIPLPCPEEIERKFAVFSADFFGYKCNRIPCLGEDIFVRLPIDAEVICDGQYLFCDDGLLSRLFPQEKVYPLEKDLLVFSAEELSPKNCFLLKVDREAMRRYYAYLALFSAFCAEQDDVAKAKQKDALDGDIEAIIRKLPQKEEAAEEIAFLPPLCGAEEGTIEGLLSSAGKTICFPYGGVWSGLIPVLKKHGVQKIILPRVFGSESFLWEEKGVGIRTYFHDVFFGEERIVRSYLSGYRGFPELAPLESSEPERSESGKTFSFLSTPVTFACKAEMIGDEGDGAGLIAEKKRIANGIICVSEQGRDYCLEEKGVKLSLRYGEGLRSVGKMSARNYVSGRFAVTEGHFYYRLHTARMRLLTESGQTAVRVDWEGEGDFALVIEIPDGKRIVCGLPYQDVEYEAGDGVFYARDKMTVIGDKRTITIKSAGIECKKEGEKYILSLQNVYGKKSIIID